MATEMVGTKPFSDDNSDDKYYQIARQYKKYKDLMENAVREDGLVEPYTILTGERMSSDVQQSFSCHNKLYMLMIDTPSGEFFIVEFGQMNWKSKYRIEKIIKGFRAERYYPSIAEIQNAYLSLEENMRFDFFETDECLYERLQYQLINKYELYTNMAENPEKMIEMLLSIMSKKAIIKIIKEIDEEIQSR
jgi:hypothetical protein